MEQSQNNDMIEVPKLWYLKMRLWGLTPDNNVRDHNVGASNYSNLGIQVWTYWLANNISNPFIADVIAYLTRTKEGESRKQTYQKVKHYMEELIRQEEVKEEIDIYTKVHAQEALDAIEEMRHG